MKSRPSPFILIDGSFAADPQAQRANAVANMAKDLIVAGTYGNERDAIRTLIGRYRIGDIMALLDDARQVAMQHVVAREMSAS